MLRIAFYNYFFFFFGVKREILLFWCCQVNYSFRSLFQCTNTKVKVRFPDGDTDYFDIVVGVLQGDTVAPYLCIICLDNVLRTSIDKIKENGFELTKKRSGRYPTKTITDADDADDLAILANTPTQAIWKSDLTDKMKHSFFQVAIVSEFRVFFLFDWLPYPGWIILSVSTNYP